MQPEVDCGKSKMAVCKLEMRISISLYTQDSNEITTDTPMFLEYSYPIGIVAMMYDRMGRIGSVKYKIAA